MRCAEAIASLSHARRRQVGCIIVGQDGIIAEGVNGTPSGFDNNPEVEHPEHRLENRCDDDGIPQRLECSRCGKHWPLNAYTGLDPCLTTKPELIHAESNAITKIARSTNSGKGSTVYTTLQPCFNCAKLLIQMGVARVVYKEVYINTHGGDGGLELLQQAGIIVENYYD